MLAVASVFGSGHFFDGHENGAFSNRKPGKYGNISLEHAGEHRLECNRPFVAIVVSKCNNKLVFAGSAMIVGPSHVIA